MRYHILLLRTAAIYALIGAFMGSHIAGPGIMSSGRSMRIFLWLAG
ncbi:hypothetical protein RCG23_08375 [Neobacillus sp. PS3-34]|nr:hypothetical protein [Neobacillus sp. PS3-34]WML49879.1 hypothetical protein RCG23_08375 [Neobacillus sp. PS3-34]